MDIGIFYLNNRPYGIDVGLVKEVVPLPEITPIGEETPPFIKGAINLRGEVIPVMDLALRMGWKRKNFELENSVMVVKCGHHITGLIVDRLKTVVSLSEGDMIKNISILDDIISDFISNAGIIDKQMVFIINVKNILDYRIKTVIKTAEKGMDKGEDESINENNKKVFHERAIDLSVCEEEEDTAEFMNVIAFTLGEEQYGIDVNYVLESHKVKKICKIYNIPSYFLGLTNLRGEILTVINIQNFLGMNTIKNNASIDVLVIEVDNIKACIQVDKIIGVVKFSKESMCPPLNTLDKAHKEFIVGEVAVDNNMMIILDLERIARDEKMFVTQHV